MLVQVNASLMHAVSSMLHPVTCWLPSSVAVTSEPVLGSTLSVKQALGELARLSAQKGLHPLSQLQQVAFSGLWARN